MTTDDFTCPDCGTITSYTYSGCGSYDQLFADSPEEVTVFCKNPECRNSRWLSYESIREIGLSKAIEAGTIRYTYNDGLDGDVSWFYLAIFLLIPDGLILIAREITEFREIW